MMEEEELTGRSEGAAAVVPPVVFDSGAAEEVGGVGSGGGASLEEAPSLMEEGILLSMPSGDQDDVNAGVEAAVLQEEQPQAPDAPPSPIRRIDLDQISEDNIPTDQIIFTLSGILVLDNKKGVTSDLAPFLWPQNKQFHRLPPPHIIGWDDFSWREVILALYIWNRIMTKDERQKEQRKSKLVRTNDSARYRVFQRNIQKLHTDRPTIITDVAANSNAEPVVAPRRSSQRVDEQNYEGLVSRAQEHAGDPSHQERARQAARTATATASTLVQRQRRRTATPAPPVAPVNIVGVASAETDRQDIVQQRQAGRQSWKKRKQGNPCTSVGMQGDAHAKSTVNSFHRSAAVTTETLYYAQLQENQPRHAVMAVSYNQLDKYNPEGGRSSSTGRQSEKPSITITAESRDDAVDIVKQMAKALAEMKDKEESSDGVYELGNVFLRCNFKESPILPLQETVRRRQDAFASEHLARPTRNRATMGQVQQGMPSHVSADMSPGVQDRRMTDMRDDE
jgi:hypothetical protein